MSTGTTEAVNKKCPACGTQWEQGKYHLCKPDESWFVIPTAGQSVEFLALEDRLIAREDEFVSGYDCKNCKGKQFVQCSECDNGKSKLNPEISCKSCHGEMKVACPACGGKGVKEGGLVIPEKSQNNPTTGTVVSIGPGHYQNGLFIPTKLKVGDQVLYTSFSGSKLDLQAKERHLLRVLHESEILCKIRGHLEYRMGGEDSDFGALYPENA